MRLECILDYKYAFSTFSILVKSLEKKYWYCRGLNSSINQKKGEGGCGALFCHSLVIKIYDLLLSHLRLKTHQN